MNELDLFKIVVKHAHHYITQARLAGHLTDPEKNAEAERIIGLLHANYRRILQFPRLDDGRFMSVAKSMEAIRDEFGQRSTTEEYNVFREWIGDNLHHGCVPMFSENFDTIHFFFENLSDATLFKLKWV